VLFRSSLTAQGRIYLASVLGDKAAYTGMIRRWIQGAGLPQDQQKPFLAPIGKIQDEGRTDVQNTLRVAFRTELMPELERITVRFPFDKSAKDDVTPDELSDLLHPKDGKVFAFFRRYLEPISDIDERGFHPKRSVKESVTLPKGMYNVINSAAYLSGQLWDEKGKPRQLKYRLATVPFGRGPSEKTTLTLVYVNVADGSLFNFNQRSTGKTLSIDWNRPGSSQVGVQLTEVESKDNVFPRPVTVSGSSFSFLHLLMAALQPPSAVKEPPDAQLYAWLIAGEGVPKVRAELVVEDDPWQMWTLGDAVNAAAGP